ncbi:unnamed protein product, partial [Iphiclides podalirius]
MWGNIGCVLVSIVFAHTIVMALGKLDTEEDTRESGEHEVDDVDSNRTKIVTQANISADGDRDESGERLGPAVTQIYHHPYAASLQKNDAYVCSAVILNTYWSLTLSKCFDSNIISSYVTHKSLGNYTLRIGSSYNNKSGSIQKIKLLINNFDLKISAVKLVAAIEFSSRVRSVNLPRPEDDATLGYLASILAWTPNGHLRVLNAPIIDPAICESATKMLPGHYVCVGGVQDPNRNFCRRDDGGAVIQNNTLIAVAAFLHTCAVYTRAHAFPKVSSFARWLDSVIWDEDNRPTGRTLSIVHTTVRPNATENVPENAPEYRSVYGDPRNQIFSMPFDPISVPLEPAEDNSVLPRMSLYESYLQSVQRSKTSTTPDPNAAESMKQEWLRKFGKKYNIMVGPQVYKTSNYQGYDMN